MGQLRRMNRRRDLSVLRNAPQLFASAMRCGITGCHDPRLPPLLLLVLWLSEAGGGAWCAIVTKLKITHLPQKAASHPGGFFVGLPGIEI
jgi:hypothetical protein